MRRLPARWTPHTVLVRPFLGVSGAGLVHGLQEPLTGVYVEDVREVVLDDQGTEVVSNTKVHMSFDDAPREKSLVTVWPGTPFEREAPVIRVARHHHPNWPGYAVANLR